MSDEIRRAAVIGRPIAHSLSPRIHHFWLEELGLEHDYGAIEPDAADPFDQAARRARADGLVGLNVTAPFKREALAFADDADRHARRIGAANLILFREDGSTLARNTDAIGFLEALDRAGPLAVSDTPRALILGAGGAALAACRALLEREVAEIRLWNRTEARAGDLAEMLADPRVSVAATPEDGATDASLIVDATSGLDPRRLPTEFWRVVADDVLMFDLKYGAKARPMREEAGVRNVRFLDGLSMLIAQAKPSFEAFFGTPPPQAQDRLESLLQDGV